MSLLTLILTAEILPTQFSRVLQRRLQILQLNLAFPLGDSAIKSLKCETTNFLASSLSRFVTDYHSHFDLSQTWLSGSHRPVCVVGS